MANVGGSIGVLEMDEAQVAARKLGIDVVPLEVRRAEDIGPALESAKDKADALYVVSEPLVNSNRVRINTLANVARLPTIYGERANVGAGGLMSYGAKQRSRSTRFCEVQSRGTSPSNNQLSLISPLI
jgi:putative ABC transport system substrate-binding protein